MNIIQKYGYQELAVYPVRPELTPAELNAAYGRLEERYNCLRSNWEWFTRPIIPGWLMALPGR
ncbi:MAG: hypothetical protein PWP41_965 [Moorella sp. (in: firmicutes)]|uniref:Uncharacterized protein n=1 Tax=Neomoorella thermoacetica TaxID=1525 RepID=A0A1J5P7A3_NEOTH|nr:hypothetical protein [Moorella sp. (in: firmicutes)]OIQ61243.1 hypothetical protein MOTE_03190 [Moorella thermoacetica]